MPSESGVSVTTWLGRLRAGSTEAAEQLWVRYFDRLVVLAHQRLLSLPSEQVDSEDVALSVLKSLCLGAVAGRFASVSDRHELWCLLVAMTHRKVVEQASREAAANGATLLESKRADLDLDAWPAEEPTPEQIAMLAEESARLIGILPGDVTRRVAKLRLEGWSNVEIASNVGVSLRSVERKLQLIRERWSQDLNQ